VSGVVLVQFTAFTYQQTVEPQREATFEYSFVPNEAFSSRAFGLTVNINYRDSVSTVQLESLKRWPPTLKTWSSREFDSGLGKWEKSWKMCSWLCTVPCWTQSKHNCKLFHLHGWLCHLLTYLQPVTHYGICRHNLSHMKESATLMFAADWPRCMCM